MYSAEKFIDEYLDSFARTHRQKFSRGESPLPKLRDIETLNEQLLTLFFPGHQGTENMRSLRSVVGYSMQIFTRLLCDSIKLALIYESPEISEALAEGQAAEHTDALAAELGNIRAMLKKDAAAGFEGDPAADSIHEIILSYPGIKAIAVNRTAHFLYKRHVPLIPRMMAEAMHQKTGIDIHPGAEIGESFFIDHGTGASIGETAVIGDRVRIYQGVAIGAFSESSRIKGKTKRHPTIGDDVIIYPNASILGDITVGNGSIIVSNTLVTEDIPERMLVKPSASGISIRPL